MTRDTCLPKESIAFLKDLAAHNDKKWFAANKGRYEGDLVEPMRALVRTLTEDLAAVSKEITGDDAKSGGSLTRIFRDTRFSRDKSPYHTHVGAHFWHRKGKKMELPGFFLRVDAKEVLLGTGMHGPDKGPLERIRKAIDADPKGWERAVRDRTFLRLWKGLEGESLKRVPAPWPADHAHGEDLRRKDFTAFARLPAAAATKPDFAKKALAHWAASKPLMGFLCRTLGLPF